MEPDKHLRIAGALQIVQAITFSLIGVLYVIFGFLDVQASPKDASEHFVLLLTLILAVALFVGVWQLWFGISLARQKPWITRVWGFICCVPSLASFPHLIGAYTLWALIRVSNRDAKTIEPQNGHVPATASPPPLH